MVIAAILGKMVTLAKEYSFGFAERAMSVAFRSLTRAGIGARYRYVLTVRERKSGKSYSTPVDVMDVAGDRWLVAPYGEVNWVRNARAADMADLARGGVTEHFGIEEATTAQAVPVIREYIRYVPVTRSYWECGAESTDDEIVGQVPSHPVFRLVQVSA